MHNCITSSTKTLLQQGTTKLVWHAFCLKKGVSPASQAPEKVRTILGRRKKNLGEDYTLLRCLLMAVAISYIAGFVAQTYSGSWSSGAQYSIEALLVYGLLPIELEDGSGSICIG